MTDEKEIHKNVNLLRCNEAMVSKIRRTRPDFPDDA